jgi:hypothetical protein
MLLQPFHGGTALDLLLVQARLSQFEPYVGDTNEMDLRWISSRYLPRAGVHHYAVRMLIFGKF